MRRFALVLGFALALNATSAVAQNCDGFVDVLASSPFCPDVTWLKTYGVTKGCDATHFCPNDNVSRLEMAAFMHRLGKDPAFMNGGNAFGAVATLGSTDDYPLYLLVDNQPVVVLQPAVDPFYGYNPNVTSGQVYNAASLGVAGATIAGGGGCNPGTGGTCGTLQANQVTGGFGTVGGGAVNTAGAFATVAGGYNNTASGFLSTIAAGAGNVASGAYSFAAGAGNVASAANSFAVGSGASATFPDSFAWSSWSSGASGTTFFPYRFHIFGDHGLDVEYCSPRADGGGTCWVVIGDQFAGQAIATSTGAYLSTGGIWMNNSDRERKADFTAVDAQAVLAKVAQLPIDEWRYKSEEGQRHLGPVAQDFYAAFGLGADDKHISTLDEGGVALAAIKGLNAKVEEQAVTIGEQQREIAELTERVQKAEALATDVVALKAALAELQRERQTVAVK